jgi:hypothetical protein
MLAPCPSWRTTPWGLSVTAYSVYIHTYPSYLEAICSIHNLRTCHTVVTRDPLNMIHYFNTYFYTNCFLQENWCGCSGLCNLSNTGILKYFEINISPTKLNLTTILLCMELTEFQIYLNMMFVFRCKYFRAAVLKQKLPMAADV